MNAKIYEPCITICIQQFGIRRLDHFPNINALFMNVTLSSFTNAIQTVPKLENCHSFKYWDSTDCLLPSGC